MLYTPAFWAMALANLCHTASFSAFFLLPLYILEHGGMRVVVDSPLFLIDDTGRASA